MLCVRAIVVSISISSSSREVSPVAVLLYISEAHYKQLLNSWHWGPLTLGVNVSNVLKSPSASAKKKRYTHIHTMSSKYGELMDEFAQWGTNIKFNTALEEWMEDHCEGM